MTTIKLLADDQHLSVVSEPKLASGDQKSVEVQVAFSAEWNNYTKSAVFFTERDRTVYEVLLVGGKCTVPHEVLCFSGVMYVGVRGVTLETVKTSTLVRYRVEKGAPVGTGTAVEPTPDIYQQILDRVETVTKIAESAFIVNDASGEIITTNDSSNYQMKGLNLYGKTIPNGTPTPEAPVPLESVGADGNVAVTVCGKNLLDAHSFHRSLNKSLVVSEDGYTITATGGSDSEWAASYVTIPVEVFRGKTIFIAHDGYTFTNDAKTLQFRIRLSNGKYSYQEVSSEVSRVDIPQDATDIRLSIFTNNTSQKLDSDNTVTVKGLRISWSSDSDWSMYTGANLTAQTPNGLPGIPVSSGGNYTDENGQQWVCDEIDFARGKYVKRVHSTTITDAMTFTPNGDIFCIEESIPDSSLYNSKLFPPNKRSGWNVNTDAMSDKFTNFIVGDGSCIGAYQTCIGLYINGSRGIYISYGEQNQTLDGLKKILPISLNYRLQTPDETDLTAEEIAQYSALHTNYPNTTIYNDSGAGMGVKYVADTKLYIDNKFNELALAILNNA